MSDNITDGKRIIKELTNLLSKMEGDEVKNLLSDSLEELFVAMLNPEESYKYANIAEYLLANRHRWAFIGVLVDSLVATYCIAGKSPEGKNGYISPTHHQWFEDGVMYLEGEKRLAGALSLYKGAGQAFTGIIKRDITGNSITKDDIEFIPIAEAKLRLITKPKNRSEIYAAIDELAGMLSEQENDEGKYQEFLRRNNWIFGLEYKQIDRHIKLSPNDIPDFTGVKVIDGSRDIFEIKPPFARLFNADNGFSKDFHEHWFQAEKYLTYAIRSKLHLASEHGLHFNHPKCYLIMGYNLSDEQNKLVSIKRSASPIEFMTYNDILAYAKNTAAFIDRITNSILTVSGEQEGK